MKGLLPNEFPFSRKRKPARRKAVAQPQVEQIAAPESATLSAPIAGTVPQAEIVATPATTNALTALTLSLDITMSLSVVRVSPPATVPPAKAAAVTEAERPMGTAATA